MIRTSTQVNEEFDKEFVRDDGLMDKYTWKGTNSEDFGPNPMADSIKSHISTLRKEDLTSLLEQIHEKRVIHADKPWTSEDASYAKALDDIKALIKKNMELI